jgi:hypothetical protein
VLERCRNGWIYCLDIQKHPYLAWGVLDRQRNGWIYCLDTWKCIFEATFPAVHGTVIFRTIATVFFGSLRSSNDSELLHLFIFEQLFILCCESGLQVATLPNLEVPQFVGDKVLAAKQNTETAIAAAEAGDYGAAIEAARAARVAAEVVATHHSIVSQHSYPEQHKVALYLPLFAPLALPLFGSFVVELKRLLFPTSL